MDGTSGWDVNGGQTSPCSSPKVPLIFFFLPLHEETSGNMQPFNMPGSMLPGNETRVGNDNNTTADSIDHESRKSRMDKLSR
jgi:hypothetical protein